MTVKLEYEADSFGITSIVVGSADSVPGLAMLLQEAESVLDSIASAYVDPVVVDLLIDDATVSSYRV